jgi:hypothetical protein
VRRAATALALAPLALAAPAAAATPRTITGLHGQRYCEIFELRGTPPNARATVWNTIGRNLCPPAQWNAIDTGAIARERGDTAVVLNGPRRWVIDAASGKPGRRHTFQGLGTTEVASIPIRSAADLGRAPYTDRVIARTNTWRWKQGRRVFELVAPGGDVYVMQSYAQIVDTKLRLAQLPRLGKRLSLPEGWRYRTRVLKHAWMLKTTRAATIVQDDLQDTYQLAKAVRHGKRAKHAVSLAGRTKSVGPITPSRVEDRGTITGTPFGKGTIVLVGKFVGGNRLAATYRLRFKHGSVLGSATLPFTIKDGTITFRGMTTFTGGTGRYRGITGRGIKVVDTNTLDGQNGRIAVKGAARY